MKTTKTIDNIAINLDMDRGVLHVSDRMTIQYRGLLAATVAEHTVRAEALFAAIPRLTYSQIPGAVKRLRAGKTAIDERAAKVATYRAGVADGSIQPERPMTSISAATREHMAVCRSMTCRVCRGR
jgi:sulfite reductase beta subunit-like hemoprotein